MLIPYSWLSDYVEDLPTADELARKLTMGGLEAEVSGRDGQVEGLRGKLVVARIAGLRAHPNADRLSLCQVEDGEGNRDVVCGATNMKAGDLVVLARPGAVLPDGLKIKKSKIRGEVSAGMLCSAAELGIDGDHGGILILDGGEPGACAVETLALDDPIVEVSVTPNRGDCLSVRGLAREIHAVLGLGLKPVFAQRSKYPGASCEVSVSVDGAAGCLLYRGIEVRGVKVAPSPASLARKLTASGLRPLNNIVDVTNLVMMELGQPLHAFDRDLLKDGLIKVCPAGRGREFEALDGVSHTLEPEDLVIADGQGPVAVAGVIGGMRTAVGRHTSNIFLESAIFDPACIRRTSRRLGLTTESSYRFSRGVDPSLVGEALLRAATMIAELGGGQVVGGVAEAGSGAAVRERIDLHGQHLNDVLGYEVPLEEAEQILASVGAGVEQHEGMIRVDVPSHRHDIDREIDLIEEVARLNGYERVLEQWPRVTVRESSLPRAFAFHRQLRLRLAARGASEVVSLTFASEATNLSFPGLHPRGGRAVRLLNPLRSGEGELRRSALPALLEAERENIRNGSGAHDIFSIGKTYSAGSPPSELLVVAGVVGGQRRARGPGLAGVPGFWDAKGAVLDIAAAAGIRTGLQWVPGLDRPEYHPRQSAVVMAGDILLGYAGMLHPGLAQELEIPCEICMFEVDTKKLLDYAPRLVRMREIRRQPAVTRDVSLLAPVNMLSASVVTVVNELGEDLIESVSVFDEYSGEGIEQGYKALTYSFIYRADDRTLTDDEVTALHSRVVEHVVSRLDVEVRVR
ncbi:MAG: phenylalanine--tRNA ligase subunit beta [Deltaproteobacteria bacterium]